MTGFRQARWDERLIFELSGVGRIGYQPVRLEEGIIKEVGGLERRYPQGMIRREIGLPRVSQPQIVRHYTRLSQMNFGVDTGTYPLGSCTMKYSPKIMEKIAAHPQVKHLHPDQPVDTVQGILEILHELAGFLEEITGMDRFSLQPAAGAQGELTGALMIREFNRSRGELKIRREMIIPDSAHGTNPASARMAGFAVVEVPSDEYGYVDVEALKSVLSHRTAGMMLTNPNTLGIFEKRIREVADMTHEAGALLYYDGANLNAIAGIARPGDMGFDLVHLNLHKTFGTPHGGGGPGSGPVGAKGEMTDYLPTPIIERVGDRYRFTNSLKHSIGRVHPYHGNIAVLLRAYVYIRLYGAEGLRRAAEIAVLNSNYMKARLVKLPGIELPFHPEIPRKHEFVASFESLRRETGVSLKEVAKRLMDRGFHPPTVYFPLIVPEAFMAEPTETESKEEIDRYCEALAQIVQEARIQPEKIREAPRETSVSRIDEARASRPSTMIPSYTWLKK
ncbi:MAG: aminomethyl-transferring glycine dehydrogenase subunit GcvPB [Candidatus Geothermarchaeales archaeon]